jgi:hypothetical protein
VRCHKGKSSPSQCDGSGPHRTADPRCTCRLFDSATQDASRLSIPARPGRGSSQGRGPKRCRTGAACTRWSSLKHHCDGQCLLSEGLPEYPGHEPSKLFFVVLPHTAPTHAVHSPGIRPARVPEGAGRRIPAATLFVDCFRGNASGHFDEIPSKVEVRVSCERVGCQQVCAPTATSPCLSAQPARHCACTGLALGPSLGHHPRRGRIGSQPSEVIRANAHIPTRQQRHRPSCVCARACGGAILLFKRILPSHTHLPHQRKTEEPSEPHPHACLY